MDARYRFGYDASRRPLPSFRWADDDESQSCMNCGETFSGLSILGMWDGRKHHCRFCGRVLCNGCSSQLVKGYRACTPCLKINSQSSYHLVLPGKENGLKNTKEITFPNDLPCSINHVKQRLLELKLIESTDSLALAGGVLDKQAGTLSWKVGKFLELDDLCVFEGGKCFLALATSALVPIKIPPELLPSSELSNKSKTQMDKHQQESSSYFNVVSLFQNYRQSFIKQYNGSSNNYVEQKIATVSAEEANTLQLIREFVQSQIQFYNAQHFVREEYVEPINILMNDSALLQVHSSALCSNFESLETFQRKLISELQAAPEISFCDAVQSMAVHCNVMRANLNGIEALLLAIHQVRADPSFDILLRLANGKLTRRGTDAQLVDYLLAPCQQILINVEGLSNIIASMAKHQTTQNVDEMTSLTHTLSQLTSLSETALSLKTRITSLARLVFLQRKLTVKVDIVSQSRRLLREGVLKVKLAKQHTPTRVHASLFHDLLLLDTGKQAYMLELKHCCITDPQSSQLEKHGSPWLSFHCEVQSRQDSSGWHLTASHVMIHGLPKPKSKKKKKDQQPVAHNRYTVVVSWKVHDEKTIQCDSVSTTRRGTLQVADQLLFEQKSQLIGGQLTFTLQDEQQLPVYVLQLTNVYATNPGRARYAFPLQAQSTTSFAKSQPTDSFSIASPTLGRIDVPFDKSTTCHDWLCDLESTCLEQC